MSGRNSIFLCPRINRSGAYCFTVCLSVSLSVCRKQPVNLTFSYNFHTIQGQGRISRLHSKNVCFRGISVSQIHLVGVFFSSPDTTCSWGAFRINQCPSCGVQRQQFL